MYQATTFWPDRTKTLETPLFPGYVFCRLNARPRIPVLFLPGVLSIVGIGIVPTAIPEEEIVAIQTVITSGLQYGPWSKASEGLTIRVERGSVAGLEGTVVRAKSGLRLIVALPLIQQSVFVKIDQDCIAVLPSFTQLCGSPASSSRRLNLR
jgi:transcription antitermination factor NusG